MTKTIKNTKLEALTMCVVALAEMDGRDVAEAMIAKLLDEGKISEEEHDQLYCEMVL